MERRGMPNNIKSFRELQVWQRAMDNAMEVFQLSKKFPADERYSMTDQIRRAARSVPANLAEAWRRRRYEKAFISKMNDAETEASETQTWLELALRHNYITIQEAAKLDARYEHLLAQIVTMITQPDKWILQPRPISGSSSPRLPVTQSPRHTLEGPQ